VAVHIQQPNKSVISTLDQNFWLSSLVAEHECPQYVCHDGIGFPQRLQVFGLISVGMIFLHC